jgi:aspartate/glutamate racemase
MSQEALDLALKDKCCCVALAATDNLREVEPTVAELHEVVESVTWPPICRQVDVHMVELWRCVTQKLLSISVKRVLVLGTKDDMSSPFIKEQLEQFGIKMVDMSNYPEEVERIDQIIQKRRIDNEGVIGAKEFLVNVVWQIPPELPNCPGAVVLANHILSEYICSDDPVPSPVIDAVEEHIRCLVAEALEE